MTAADRPFINDASRLEKAEIHANERKLKRAGDREPTTLHALSRLGQDEEPSGRFAEARYVTGSEPSTQYPAAAPPWQSQSDAGLEPPLNQDVNFVEPVGEAFEVEASIAEQEELGGEPGAITQSRVPDQELHIIGALEGSPPPSLTGTTAPADPPFSAVKPIQALAPCVGETVPVNPTPEQPDDGLDVPRRSDGFPMSSHAVKPRRKLA
jgi:hypothetical protein